MSANLSEKLAVSYLHRRVRASDALARLLAQLAGIGSAVRS